MTGFRTLLIAGICTLTLAAPRGARAETGPWPGGGLPFPQMPSEMPTIQPTPDGGYSVIIPGYPTVVIPDISGLTGILAAPNQPSMPTNPPPIRPNDTPWESPTNTPAPTSPTPTPPAPAAPPTSSGRVVGVFAGISDYPGGNDLDNCAHDARNMAGAFINAGIIAPTDAIMLTDQQATRRNLLSSIRQLSSRIGANDTLVLFFSGHGDNRPDTNGDELDGMDETIILYDGALLDDELANALSQARGRDLLALDTCYSGGFDRDLSRVAQSVGFYASREDQLSYVAGEFGAGGYLSHFMRTGVETNRGRQLQVGQLRQHIAQGFATSGAAGRQELVVGTGQGATMATILYDPSSNQNAPAYVASR